MIHAIKMIINNKLRNRFGKEFKFQQLETLIKSKGKGGYCNLPKYITMPKHLIGRRVRILFELLDTNGLDDRGYPLEEVKKNVSTTRSMGKSQLIEMPQEEKE